LYCARQFVESCILKAPSGGNYARLQWLYRFVEKRNSTLRAVVAAAAGVDDPARLGHPFATNANTAGNPRHACRSAGGGVAAMRYERIGNLREAVTFLALAEFRGLRASRAPLR